jgi:hypothetical protein
VLTDWGRIGIKVRRTFEEYNTCSLDCLREIVDRSMNIKYASIELKRSLKKGVEKLPVSDGTHIIINRK